MTGGLTDIELSKLQEVFSRYAEIEMVVLYGSRAKGSYKPFSDVDITLFAEEVTDSRFSKLLLDIDDLLLPYQFDISIFRTITNADLIDHIQRVGVVIYQK
jgi:predicted nucleotidyltransferase